MFGKIVRKVKCVCGIEIACEYGVATQCYEDKNGEFYVSPHVVCPKCGHQLNSERISDAKFTGETCF